MRREQGRSRKRRRKQKIRRAAGLAVAVMLCLAGIKLFSEQVIRMGKEPEIGTQDTVEGAGTAKTREEGRETEPEESAAAELIPTVDLAQLYSPCAVLTEADSGRILAEHNGGSRIYPASLTKIMTAVIVLENLEDLSETIVLPEEIFGMLYVRHASLAGFEPGEEVCVRDLLYGILLPSGAECSIACAKRIAGSEEGFVELMNRKAANLGMEDTHFCNATGLHEEEHYSTVRDMAVLLRYALENDTLREILSTKSHTTEATGFHPDGLTFTSTLFSFLDTAKVPGGEILGGKTGYTKEAGLCLASFADIDGKEYILVTAGAEGSHRTEPFHVLDAQKVYGELAARG